MFLYYSFPLPPLFEWTQNKRFINCDKLFSKSSCQRTSWQCTFLQITDILDFYISLWQKTVQVFFGLCFGLLGSVTLKISQRFIRYVQFCCHKHSWKNVKPPRLVYPILLLQTQLENVQTLHQKYPVASPLQMLKLHV